MTAAVLLTAGTFGYAAETTTRVSMSDLPAAAQKTVHNHLGKGKVGEIDKVVEQGEVTYEVELKKGGKDRTITVAEDGELLELEIFLNETPAVVHRAIQKRLGSGTLEGITKLFDGDKASFEVETASNGKTKTFTLSETGKLLEMEVAAGETPAPVQATIRKEAAGEKLGVISQLFEDGEITYEVELNPETTPRTITIDPKGQVLAREITIQLADAPEPVQKKIKELSGNGRIGRITKTTEGDEITYDVEQKAEGKWESKTIGTNGKFVD